MIEIRIHGRGGQGAVVASKMLVTAAAKEGKKVGLSVLRRGTEGRAGGGLCAHR